MCKSTLLQHSEKYIDRESRIYFEVVTTLDRMVLVRKIKTAEKAFAKVSDYFLQSVFNYVEDSIRIGLVFEVYLKQSIKNTENLIRAS